MKEKWVTGWNECEIIYTSLNVISLTYSENIKLKINFTNFVEKMKKNLSKIIFMKWKFTPPLHPLPLCRLDPVDMSLNKLFVFKTEKKTFKKFFEINCD